MFSNLSKIFRYITGHVDTRYENSFEDPFSGTNGDSESLQTRNFVGKITSLHSAYGLIDHNVYFEYSAVLGSARPKLGDRVQVQAVRSHGDGGWRGQQVSVTGADGILWGEDDNGTSQSDCTVSQTLVDVPTQKTVVAIVTHVTYNGGTINDDIPFDQSSCIDGYRPLKGDWVTACLNTTELSKECRAISIYPLREQEYEGEINNIRQGFGFVDNDVYFTLDVCINGYRPRRGDWVVAQIMESAQRNCCWRAVRVAPKPRMDSSRNKKVTDRGTSFPSPTEGKFMKKLLRNKNKIVITDTVDFKRVKLGQKAHFTIFIRNTGSEPQTLLKCTFKSGAGCQFAVTCIEADLKTSLEADTTNCVKNELMKVLPGKSLHVTIQCCAKQPGTDRQLLVFDFKNFKIGRHVTANVYDPQQDVLNPSAPYQRRRRNQHRDSYNDVSNASNSGWVIPGQRPTRSMFSVQLPNKLAQFPIPQELRDCLHIKRDIVDLIPALGESLSLKNYQLRFSTLLHLEEIQVEVEMREFDMQEQCLRRVGEFLALKVPGLAEGRPSVLIGDTIILIPPNEGSGRVQYEGFIHEVLSEDILIKCHNQFHQTYAGESYNIMFNFNRTSLRRCHQAVSMACKLGNEVLFAMDINVKKPQVKLIVKKSLPKKVVHSAKLRSNTKPQNPHEVPQEKHKLSKPSCAMNTEIVQSKTFEPTDRAITDNKGFKGADCCDGVRFFNETLNERQRAAVIRILGGLCRPSPYILFGPPGTGKTVTVVEAILQVFRRIPRSRIIACTPSNSAADLLAERLIRAGVVSSGDLVRLNAFSRNEDNIPEVIKSYCSNGEDLSTVSRHRILVCTCASAGMLYALRLRVGHFTHVFVDEAGQATEPECLIPIGLCAGTDNQIVLAGDPMQLGAVLRSKLSQAYGLGYSLLERLMDSPMYARNEVKFSDHGCYDPLLVTKLVNNYRSHPILLKLPSRLFYHDELANYADKQTTESLCDWEMLPYKNRPIIFHGLCGEDLREGNSPSWFNAVEAVQVMKYLQALVNNTCHPLTYDDIGIITPYRKQVEKIRLLIDKLGMERVKVGSVEEFQGQERLVIIISTVRSSDNLLKFDQVHNLGFLSNPKRFNVAITRAQALVIILGNPHLLSHDEHWLALLNYCVHNKTYIGCNLPEPMNSNMEEMSQSPETETGHQTDIVIGKKPTQQGASIDSGGSFDIEESDRDNQKNGGDVAKQECEVEECAIEPEKPVRDLEIEHDPNAGGSPACAGEPSTVVQTLDTGFQIAENKPSCYGEPSVIDMPSETKETIDVRDSIGAHSPSSIVEASGHKGMSRDEELLNEMETLETGHKVDTTGLSSLTDTAENAEHQDSVEEQKIDTKTSLVHSVDERCHIQGAVINSNGTIPESKYFISAGDLSSSLDSCAFAAESISAEMNLKLDDQTNCNSPCIETDNRATTCPSYSLQDTYAKTSGHPVDVTDCTTPVFSTGKDVTSLDTLENDGVLSSSDSECFDGSLIQHDGDVIVESSSDEG